MEAAYSPRRIAFFVLYGGFHLFLFVFGFFKQKDDPHLSLLNGLKLSVWASRGAGLVLAFDCAMVLLPVCRNFIRVIRASFLNNYIPFDENIWFHKVTAYCMFLFTLIHVVAHYVNFFNVEYLNVLPLYAWQIHYQTWAGATGHILLLIMLLMYTTAQVDMRNQCFEAFWYTHHLGLVFMYLMLWHAYGCFVHDFTSGQCKPYNSYQYILVSYGLYLLERVYREYRSRLPTHISKVVGHPAKTIEIQFKKPSFKYRPGMYLFMNVPEVSYWQWHPFTITSSPYEDYISIHVRQVGDFTTALGKRLGCNSSKGDGEIGQLVRLPRLRVDGPFGAPTEDVFEHQICVLVGGGIGVTPFAAILKDIWYRHQRKDQMTIQRVEFFWICRDTESFEWFQSLLATLEAASLHQNFLRIHIYLTARLRQSMIQNIVLNDDTKGGVDPLTSLASRTHYGRPNFSYIFEQLKYAIWSGSYLPGANQDQVNVGVFFCGPGPLAKQIRKDALEASSQGITFKFAKEHF